MRRRKLLVALAWLAVVVAAGVVVLWPRENRITQENCDRIKEGMSQAEVEAILGPSGDTQHDSLQLLADTLRRVGSGPCSTLRRRSPTR
jgi:hypothetical protein